ncbi:sialidase family protein [Paenibacillus ginsengarvi]|uniref:Exo-alpha-sialidase n=1 Tax=Paenibacillus ginsengarvi TaxID=400777 RepID=A0A3B0AM15_9BACL|nr:sialidase family protein [Paenibacillus ginsengarvi]RKN61334.1 exo-alpha-sialidase [Paenibacillus ginsengarvi]
MIEYVTVAEAGAGNPRNDTASIMPLSDGRLLLVWHKYEDSPGGGSDFGLCRIYSKMSRDGGRSWGEEKMLVDVLPGDHNVQAPGMSRLPSGDLLLHCLRGHHGASSSTMCLFRSTDDGLTWREAGSVWERSEGQWLQGGANHMNVLADGRLLLPFHFGTGHQGSQHNTIGCFLSDDEGRSWRQADSVVDLPMRGAMEASVAELADGRLIMSIRTQLGAVFLSHSGDRGETWSLPQTSSVPAPESCTCLRTIPSTGDLVLFYNGSQYDPARHHFGLRTPLSAALSRDGGSTWRKIGDIENGPYEYMNLNCRMTEKGGALLTYAKVEDPQLMHSDGSLPFKRKGLDLCLALIEPEWFY